ncbi:MAG: hypothetical protein ACI9SC_003350 [Gammaproteobacteria bacterium]|jgi:hypothetical protein
MKSLPAKFAAIEPFVAAWSLENELLRSQRRWSASVEEYEAFYDAMLPVLDDVLSYLDQYKLGAIPDEALPLYHLTLAFAEAAPHNELYECANEVPNSFSASRFVAAHGEQIDN